MIDHIRILRGMMTRIQKIRFIQLMFLQFINLILEAVGIGAIIPILALIIEPQKLLKYEVVQHIVNFLNIKGESALIKVSLVSLLLFYVFRTIFSIVNSYYQQKFIIRFLQYMNDRLFKGYLTSSYSFHLKRNSSELIKNMTFELTYLENFIKSFISIIVEIGLIFSILITLILIEPIGAISIILFFILISILYHKYFKNKIKKWGSENSEKEKVLSQIRMESLMGIKETILFGKLKMNINLFRIFNKHRRDLDLRISFVNTIPRSFFEFIAILSLVIFIYIMYIQGYDISKLIIILGAFVAAVFKLLPSLVKMMTALQGVKVYSNCLNILNKEFELFQENTEFEKKVAQEVRLTDKLEFKNVSFHYEGGMKKILDQVNFISERGKTYGFKGESGAGKSTMIDILIGLLNPTEGEIYVDNVLLTKENMWNWRKSIGYVPQSIYLTDSTIKKNIAFCHDDVDIDDKKIEKAIEQSNLKEFIDSLPYKENTKIGEQGIQLSGGQRQRLGIARALYNDPEVLVLDEATSALDTYTETKIMDSITKLKNKKTIFIIAHRLSTLENCHHVYEIKGGKII